MNLSFLLAISSVKERVSILISKTKCTEILTFASEGRTVDPRGCLEGGLQRLGHAAGFQQPIADGLVLAGREDDRQGQKERDEDDVVHANTSDSIVKRFSLSV